MGPGPGAGGLQGMERCPCPDPIPVPVLTPFLSPFPSHLLPPSRPWCSPRAVLRPWGQAPCPRSMAGKGPVVNGDQDWGGGEHRHEGTPSFPDAPRCDGDVQPPPGAVPAPPARVLPVTKVLGAQGHPWPLAWCQSREQRDPNLLAMGPRCGGGGAHGADPALCGEGGGHGVTAPLLLPASPHPHHHGHPHPRSPSSAPSLARAPSSPWEQPPRASSALICL